jgi:hypothetical protein
MRTFAGSPTALALPLLMLLPLTATAASTADLPKRKPGLWEIKQDVEGVPAGAMPPIQQCIDATTDDLLQQRGQRMAKASCSRLDAMREGNRMIVHSVCSLGQSNAIADSVFSGDFNTTYRAEIRTRYSPPFQGLTQMATTMEAKWLGPCPGDMRPGDVSVGGMKFNPMQMQGQSPRPSGR